MRDRAGRKEVEDEEEVVEEERVEDKKRYNGREEEDGYGGALHGGFSICHYGA